jgi:putative protein-disulfide isomerase
MANILHYIYDPLCGWCYAAAAMTEAAAIHAPGNFEIKLHAGGLFARTKLSEAQRQHIRAADSRIGEMTGQIFSEAYLNGLLSDPDTVYDSSMPIRGILAADRIKPGTGLAMLQALQQAHFRRGLRIVEASTIADVAGSIGLDEADFIAAFEEIGEGELEQHLVSTHRLMSEVGARGFPTYVAQTGERFEVLSHDRHYGDAEGFTKLVSRVLG